MPILKYFKNRDDLIEKARGFVAANRYSSRPAGLAGAMIYDLLILLADAEMRADGWTLSGEPVVLPVTAQE